MAMDQAAPSASSDLSAERILKVLSLDIFRAPLYIPARCAKPFSTFVAIVMDGFLTTLLQSLSLPRQRQRPSNADLHMSLDLLVLWGVFV